MVVGREPIASPRSEVRLLVVFDYGTALTLFLDRFTKQIQHDSNFQRFTYSDLTHIQHD